MSNVTQGDEDVRAMSLQELRTNAKMESMFDILDVHNGGSIVYNVLYD